jgi:branched-chain amino acid transport system substrate-binding protein
MLAQTGGETVQVSSAQAGGVDPGGAGGDSLRAFRAPALIALLTAIVLGLAACGAPGNDDDEVAEEGEIKIASAMPLTGPFASDGEEMDQGIRMAIAEWNDDGGLLDREIGLVTCDVAGMEVDTIQACGERLLGEDPDAIITGYDDSGANTHAFGAGDMPYLHAVAMRQAVDPVIENPDEYDNVFQYDPSDRDYGIDAAEQLPQIAEQLGFEPTNQSVAIVTTDYAYNTEGAETFADEIEGQGYEVAVNEVTEFGVEEWGPILSQIRSAEPAFTTFWNLDPSDAARFMNQWDRQFGDDGINSLLYMQFTPSIPEFLQLTGDSGEGLLWSTVLGPTDAVGTDTTEYTERFEERYGNEPRSIHPYVTRDAFEIWANAVEEAGCTRCFDEINDNIRETEYSGFAGVYQFAPLEEGQYALPGPELVPTIWSQIQGGEHVAVLPENVAEGEIQMPPWIP